MGRRGVNVTSWPEDALKRSRVGAKRTMNIANPLEDDTDRHGDWKFPIDTRICRVDTLSIHFASSGETLVKHAARVHVLNLR